LGFSGGVELAPLRSLETPCTENWAGALHPEAVRCVLPVGREMKTEIPDKFVEMWRIAMRPKKVVLLFCACLTSALLSCVSLLFAGAEGSFTGRVTDQSGAVIVGATVQATNVETNVVSSVTTNAEGLYFIRGLLPGTYRIAVSKQGFRTAVKPNVILQVQDVIGLDFSLEVGSVTQSVTVTGGAPLIEAHTSEVGTVVERNVINTLPLNGRQFLDLAKLSPGVSSGNGGPQGGTSDLFTRPGHDSSLSVSGGRAQNNSFLLDGVQNTDVDVNAYILSPSVDSIQEFKVQTSNFSAEFGRSSSGQINVVTKSGTNTISGTVYEFLRNNALDARPFNNPGPLPSFRQNQFGGTIGGPVLKNKTFYFGSYEGFRNTRGLSAIYTVPGVDERAGNFAPLGIHIYDPATTVWNASGSDFTRTEFAGDVIPSSRISPTAATLLEKYVPLPNLPGRVNNFLDTRAQTATDDQFSARIDHQMSSSDNFFGRYLFSNESGSIPALPGTGVLSRVRTQTLALGETHIFSTRIVNEFRFGYSRLKNARTSENAYKRDVVTELGIQGVSFGGPETWGIPHVAVSGYDDIGDGDYFLPMLLRDNIFNVHDNLTYARGKHIFKVGTEIRRDQFNLIYAFTPRGRFVFTPGFTQESIASTDTGSALANLLLGLPVWERRQIGVVPSYMRRISTNFYFQDDYKVRPNLTLNLGIRYEFTSPWVDKYGRYSNLDFSGIPPLWEIYAKHEEGVYAPKIMLPSTSGTPRGLTTLDKNNWAPRFGFAYRPLGSAKTVVRGGFGAFYGATDAESFGRSAINPPYVVSNIKSSDPFVPSIPIIGFTEAPQIGGPLGVTFVGFGTNLRTPYTLQWNLGVQRQLSQDLSVEAAYVGSASHKLDGRAPVNDALPGPGDVDPRRPFQTITLPSQLPNNLPGPLVSPYFGFGTGESAFNMFNANYHSAQLKIERRFSEGIEFLASYTFSKAITDGGSYRTQGLMPELNQDILHPRVRGLAPFDHRQRLVYSFIYELPFGERKTYLSGLRGPVQKFVGGWEIAGIYQLQSGFPVSAMTSYDSANVGREYIMADAVPGVSSRLSGSKRSTESWFNTSAFSFPPPYQFGTAGINTIIGPGINVFDFSLVKNTKISERHLIQFRAEFFNFFNHQNYGDPNSTVDDPAFGTITSYRIPARDIQFALKYYF